MSSIIYTPSPGWISYLTGIAPATAGEPAVRAEGRATEFLSVLHDHRRLLYQIIRTYCPDREDWRDLEQEIVLQLWRSFPNYDAQYRLSTWVYRIAFNVTVTDFRKQNRRRQHESDRPAEPFFHRLAAPERDAVTEERREMLYAAIRQLRPADRSVLLLHLDGHNYAHIAEITGLTASNVGTKLNRIRQKLRTKITDR